MSARITKTVDITLDASDLADAFCAMDDEYQAQFFLDVARLMRGWGPHAEFTQLLDIGKHIASNGYEPARALVMALADVVARRRGGT